MAMTPFAHWTETTRSPAVAAMTSLMVVPATTRLMAMMGMISSGDLLVQTDSLVGLEMTSLMGDLEVTE